MGKAGLYLSICASLTGAGLGVGVGAGAAEACTSSYGVRAEQSLFDVAEETLGEASLWTKIFTTNPKLQDIDLMKLPAGTILHIPCAEEEIVARAPLTGLFQGNVELTLLTGSNYAPFSDLDWPGQGMLTEIVAAAFEETTHPVSYMISWEEQWSTAIEPLLDAKAFDMGFPVFKPDCVAEPAHEDCLAFHYSEPLVDLVILLYTRDKSHFEYRSDADLEGREICRPAGFFLHDLDRPGRRWLRDGKISLVQPATVEDCFQLLIDEKVDAVAVNEFLGTQTLFSLGLDDYVSAHEKPMSLEGLHLAISKKHWRGTTHMYRFDAGLRALKNSTRYDQIVRRHLGYFWDQVNG